MKTTFSNRFLITTFLALGVLGLSACGAGDWLGEPEKPPLAGERRSAIDFDKTLRPDENATLATFTVGEMIVNPQWPQAGGEASHAMGNLGLSENSLKKVWSANIGKGSKSRLPLTAQPIVLGESIFTLDTSSTLASFDTSNGKRRWAISVRDENENDPVISGGISSGIGMIFVTSGYNEVLAVDALSGALKWRTKTQSPSRAAPTFHEGRVFVTTLDSTIVSLNASTGTIEWEFSGIAAQTGLIGAASPAAISDMVIPAFSSGEIYALRAANGSVAWSDNLSNTLRLGGLGAVSDIRGLPVVDSNVVYAISFAGKMAAIDLISGTRIWQKDISGSKTPWLSGNRIYVITNDAQIASLDKQTGTVVWVSQLARFKDAKSKSGPIIWTGPIMGGNRLLAFSSDGRIAEIDPSKGTLIREAKNGKDMRISPVIAGQTLYILAEDGELIAYR